MKEVVQHKPAYLDKRMRVGDKILAINGQDTSTASQNYVVKLLQVRVFFFVSEPNISEDGPLLKQQFSYRFL